MDGGVMLAGDVVVEVRAVDLERYGQITPEYLDLSAKRVHCGVGSWEIVLPREHEMVPYLWEDGSGILIQTRGATFLSGPTTKRAYAATPEDPEGSVVFSGVDDNILLDDALAFPKPSEPNVELQTVSHDVRIGKAETIMKEYVRANIGSLAPASRRGLLAQRLVMQADLGRGISIKQSARFPKLGELLTEIAILSRLGYQIVQRGSDLVFEVYETKDQTPFVRFDIRNGTLSDETIERGSPATTRPIVAGQGDLTERQFFQRTSAVSLAAEIASGRQIEQFLDQRQTDDVQELKQAGDKALLEGGLIPTAVKAVPSDETTMQYEHDWNLGDDVSVLVNGQETKTSVTEVALRVHSGGTMIGASLGDVQDFDAESALGGAVVNLEKRTSALERTVEPGLAGGARLMSGMIMAWPVANPPTGWLRCDGAAVSRIVYAALFAMIGTTYGAGNGSTTFNVPNLLGRFPLGSYTGYPLGGAGGSPTHVLTVAEMPSHSHIQNAHNHSQNAHNHTNNPNTNFHMFRWGAGDGANVYLPGPQVSAGAPPNNELGAAQGVSQGVSSVIATNVAATATNQNTGGGAAHNNMPPYTVVNFIIAT